MKSSIALAVYLVALYYLPLWIESIRLGRRAKQTQFDGGGRLA